MSAAPSNQTRTLALDGARGIFDGFVQSMLQTTAMVIAVQALSAGDWPVAILASAPFLGNLVSLFYSAAVSASGARKSHLAAAPLVGAGLCFAAAGWCDGPAAFTLWTTLAIVAFQLRLTFLTSIYHENYAEGRRGVLFSRGMMLMTSSALLATFAYGQVLQRDLSHYPWLMTFAGAMAVSSGAAVAAMPSSPLRARTATNPFRNLGLLRSQPLFGYILLAWFIFGFANLWVLPLRIVYVAESERGLGLGPSQSLLILGVALECGRLLSIPVWAKLFDRANFISVRIALNAFLGAGLVVFFATSNPWVIASGSFLIGLCAGGGSLAWNLWVTHLAPPGQTHVYMSVHSFLTGLRGVVGPHVAFIALERLSLQQIGWVSGGMVALSMLMLCFAFPMMAAHRAQVAGRLAG